MMRLLVKHTKEFLDVSRGFNMFDEIFEKTKKLSERFGSLSESTRARIGFEKPDGSIESIYIHYGHPDDILKILLQSYMDEEKIQELMRLGDISTLGPEIGQKHDFNDRPKDQVNAYGRDRGESGVGSRVSKSEEDFGDLSRETGGDYFYLFQNGEWKVDSLYGDSHESKDDKE